MSITVEAVYENGVLRPIEPLLLREHEKVRITIEPHHNWVEETVGIMGWKGTAEELDHLLAELDEETGQ